jgi:hypothetical protein
VLKKTDKEIRSNMNTDKTNDLGVYSAFCYGNEMAEDEVCRICGPDMHEDNRNAYRILSGNPKGRNHLR